MRLYLSRLSFLKMRIGYNISNPLKYFLAHIYLSIISRTNLKTEGFIALLFLSSEKVLASFSLKNLSK